MNSCEEVSLHYCSFQAIQAIDSKAQVLRVVLDDFVLPMRLEWAISCFVLWSFFWRMRFREVVGDCPMPESVRCER